VMWFITRHKGSLVSATSPICGHPFLGSLLKLDQAHIAAGWAGSCEPHHLSHVSQAKAHQSSRRAAVKSRVKILSAAPTYSIHENHQGKESRHTHVSRAWTTTGGGFTRAPLNN
jgi:hypothetical protein